MAIQYAGAARKQAIASLKRYFDEALDQDIGDLKAEMMLDFILTEIAPTVYNQAIQDAQKLVQERVTEMDSSLFATEFGYWEKGARRK
jgi:uncharacterized protein (DUF2164 family)